MPKRIQRKRTKGWAKPFLSVCVTRPSYFGNPAVIGKSFEGEIVEDARHAVTIFEDGIKDGLEGFPTSERIKAELRGKDLACWCPLDQPCHADVLLRIANR